MKPLPLIAAGLVVVVLAGAVWMLLDESPAAGSTSPIAADATEESAEADVVPRAARADSQPLDVVELAEAEPAPVEEVVPASYRAALGGIIGRVVEESGEPVADLPLSLIGGGFHSLPAVDAIFEQQDVEIDPMLGSTTTDAEGRFTLTEINPRIVGLLLLDPGGPRAFLQLLDETPVTGGVRDLGDIVMPASVTLVGRIADEAGEPLPGVRVRASDLPEIIVGSGVADYRVGGGVLVSMPQGDDELTFVGLPGPQLARMWRLLPFPTTTTDSEGRFELAGVRVGVVSVVADDGLHQTLVKGAIPTGAAGGTRDVGVLTMNDGYELKGRVVDDEGQPVTGAQVMAGNQMILGPVTILRPPVLTDADGRFVVGGLRDGAARAAGRADPTGTYVASELGEAGGPDVTITLAADRSLTLAIVDGENQPVRGATLMGRNLPDDDAEEMPDFLLPPQRLDAKVSVDEGGRYVLGQLTPGLWDIAVRAPGMAFERDIHDMRFESREATITLEPGLELAVQVVAQGSGDPVEWAHVAAMPGKSNDMPITSERTDADGLAVLSGLPEGSYKLSVTHPALAVVGAEAEVPSTEPVVVELPVGGTIVGTVVDNGKPPLEPLMVTLTARGDHPPPGEMPRMTVCGLDGSFRFTNVEPGEVQLQARERVRFTNLTSWWEPFAMTPEAETSLQVESGKEVETTLVVGSSFHDIDTGQVTGQLFVNGHPGAGWKVRTWGKIRRSVTTGPDGRFHMGRLAAGDVTLLFSPAAMSMIDGSTVDTHEFELAVGDQLFVEKEITTGQVAGRVLDEAGRPLERISVSLTAAQEGRSWYGRRRSMGSSARDGRFLFEIVAEGEYVLQAQAEGYARARSEPFTVRGMGTVDGLEIRLSSAVAASGTFVLEGVDEEPRWMYMTAESDTGLEAATRPDLEQGTFEFDDLAPGTWTFTLHSSVGREFQTVTADIHMARDDLVLVFRAAPEQERQELEVAGEG